MNTKMPACNELVYLRRCFVVAQGGESANLKGSGGIPPLRQVAASLSAYQNPQSKLITS